MLSVLSFEKQKICRLTEICMLASPGLPHLHPISCWQRHGSRKLLLLRRQCRVSSDLDVTYLVLVFDSISGF